MSAHSFETIVLFFLFMGISVASTALQSTLLTGRRVLSPSVNSVHYGFSGMCAAWPPALDKQAFRSAAECQNGRVLLSAHFHLMDVSNDNIGTTGREEHNNPRIIGGRRGKNKRELSGRRLQVYIFTLI